MSKYSDSTDMTSVGFGKGRSFKQSVAQETAMGSVVDVLPGSDSGKSGVGDIVVRIKTDQNRILTETASPMNPHNFVVPLPNEKVHCIKDSKTGVCYYTGIASEKGLLNHLLNANDIAKVPGTSVPYSGKYFTSMPLLCRTLDLYEGDVVMQGRFGQSLRFAGSNPSLDLPWKSSTNSATPITILRNGYLPVEDFETDSAGIWLTSDQEVSIPLNTNMPADLQNTRDNFGSGQIILFSDRIVLGTKNDSIAMSSANTIALCTPSWQHDVDTVLDVVYDLIEKVESLSIEVKTSNQASAQQTFPVPVVGSTGLSVQAPRFASITSNAQKIELEVGQIKRTLEALKQN